MKFLESPVWLINKGGSILGAVKLAQPTQRHRRAHDKHALQWACSFLGSFTEEYESSGWKMKCGMGLLPTRINLYSRLDLRAVALVLLCFR